MAFASAESSPFNEQALEKLAFFIWQFASGRSTPIARKLTARQGSAQKLLQGWL